MKRFVDLRKTDVDYKFCWFDTVREQFEIFDGCQVFDTWEEFEESFDGTDLERYKNLCPFWVFSCWRSKDRATKKTMLEGKK
jgi:hypothetical protein